MGGSGGGRSRPRADGSTHYLCHSDFSCWSRASDSWKQEEGTDKTNATLTAAGLPEQNLFPLESVSPRLHPGKPKHLLVKVFRRVPLLAHFGIHSFTHSFTRHVIPSTTGLLKAPVPQARSSVSLQSIPEPVGSAPAEVRGLYPHPVWCLSSPSGEPRCLSPRADAELDKGPTDLGGLDNFLKEVFRVLLMLCSQADQFLLSDRGEQLRTFWSYRQRELPNQ